MDEGQDQSKLNTLRFKNINFQSLMLLTKQMYKHVQIRTKIKSFILMVHINFLQIQELSSKFEEESAL